MLRGREAQAIPFALAGLLLSITAVDVLLFYFKQFVAAAYATVDFLLIAALSFYRRRYLPGRE
jgi:hypothetical protein